MRARYDTGFSSPPGPLTESLEGKGEQIIGVLQSCAKCTHVLPAHSPALRGTQSGAGGEENSVQCQARISPGHDRGSIDRLILDT